MARGLRVPCCFCGKELDSGAYGVAVEVHGWAINREQGGTNAVRHRRELGRVAHEICVDIYEQGGEQESML